MADYLREPSGGVTTEGVGDCRCRFPGCSIPLMLCGEATDGRMVVYPEDSEERTLDELINSIRNSITQVFRYRQQIAVVECIECKQSFTDVNTFIAHAQEEITSLYRRQAIMLSERQKLPGEFSCSFCLFTTTMRRIARRYIV
jgi:hypothetical protein